MFLQGVEGVKYTQTLGVTVKKKIQPGFTLTVGVTRKLLSPKASASLTRAATQYTG